MATWMVVEDEPDIYDVLLAMFEIWGIEGAAFVDGREAANWIESVDRGDSVTELPELAILDVRLPELSGPEVGARLRQSEKLRSVAIILITAYKMSHAEEEAARKLADADAFMYKPLPPMKELRGILDNIIEKRKHLTAQQAEKATALSSATAVPLPTATLTATDNTTNTVNTSASAATKPAQAPRSDTPSQPILPTLPQQPLTPALLPDIASTPPKQADAAPVTDTRSTAPAPTVNKGVSATNHERYTTRPVASPKIATTDTLSDLKPLLPVDKPSVDNEDKSEKTPTDKPTK